MGSHGYPATFHAVGVDGVPRWRTALAGDVGPGSPVVTPEAVYILGQGDHEIPGNNALYCLDRDTGEILWQEPVATVNGDVGEAIALAPDGTICVATTGLDGDGSVIMALH